MGKKSFILTFLVQLIYIGQAYSFCGFYVAKADTKLFNKASKVVYTRDEDRNVVTMASDYRGDVKDFALVVPVPTVLKKSQIKVIENKVIDHLDAYTAPRLVEYFDYDPCQIRVKAFKQETTVAPQSAMRKESRNIRLGVKIEAQYTVGEYDILILSAKDSSGLLTWLNLNKYKIPKAAESVVKSYIKQDLKFFVAKVNLKEQAKSGNKFLRPIRIAFESKKFTLPVRLGTVNADGPQDIFVFALSKKGRVEPTNYRVNTLPSNIEIPIYVKDEFAKFYQDVFSRTVEKHGMGQMVLEYAWDMNWCDPCAADPLSDQELKDLGVFWLDEKPTDNRVQRVGFPRPQSKNVFVTRLHARYTGETFPEDIKFQSTSNRENFQGRYILNHPFKGKPTCDAAHQYFDQLVQTREKRAQNLANLTGWDIQKIRNKMQLKSTKKKEDKKSWWQKI